MILLLLSAKGPPEFPELSDRFSSSMSSSSEPLPASHPEESWFCSPCGKPMVYTFLVLFVILLGCNTSVSMELSTSRGSSSENHFSCVCSWLMARTATSSLGTTATTLDVNMDLPMRAERRYTFFWFASSHT